jgi:hypothetical protein
MKPLLKLSVGLLLASFAVRVLGVLAVIAVFLYGTVALFADSVMTGLAFMGGAIIGGWVLKVLSGLLGVASVAAGQKGMQELQQDIEAAQTGRPRYNDDNVVEAEVVREVKDPEQTPKTLR